MMHYTLLIAILFVTYCSGGVLECETNSDCLAPDAVCTKNLCECRDGYTFSTNGTLCLEYVTSYAAACVDAPQCAWLQGKYACDGGRCVCAEGWRWFKGVCREIVGYGEKCVQDDQCYDGYDHFALVCTEGQCACAEGYYSRGDYDCRLEAKEIGDRCALDSDCRFEGGVCVNANCDVKSRRKRAKREAPSPEPFLTLKELDQNCVTDSDCEGVGEAVCSPLTKKCSCRRGYFASQDENGAVVCIGELGIDVACEGDSDCPIRPGKCIGGACFCDSYRFYDKGMRYCHKSMTQTNWNCTSNEWCYALGTNAYCNSSRVCSCEESYELDEHFVCRKTDSGDSSGCSQCDETLNFECIDNKCVCKDGYRSENSTCLPNIGAECSSRFPCILEHAACSADGVCLCEEGFVTPDTSTCLKVADSAGDDCIHDVQCAPNGICSDNICTCDENHVDRNGTCYEYKAIGSYCANLRECTAVMDENVICRNSKCQCPVDHQPEEGLGCRKSRTSILTPGYLCLLLTVVTKFIL